MTFADGHVEIVHWPEEFLDWVHVKPDIDWEWW
jgi:hypothetical protein